MSFIEKRRMRLLCAVAAGAIMSAWIYPASAQGAAPSGDGAKAATDAGSAAQASGGIEAVVVTARRRKESVLNVPASIEAFSGDTLQQNNISRLSDLTQITSGLTIQPSPFGNGPLTLSIRGQRQGLANIEYDSPVSVYFDEVLQARSQGMNDAFFDLDSVQVLKGPQGTLFGRNTTGGALLITSKAPTDRFEGYLDGTFGTYGLARGEGAINIPLSDSLQVRLAGVADRRGGYINDPAQGTHIDDSDTDSWRASVRFAPGDVFENNLVISGFTENDSGVAYKLTGVNTASPFAAAVLPDFNYYATQDFWTSNTTAPSNGSRIRTFAISNISSVSLGDATLKNIFGYRTVDSNIFFDLDGTSAFIADSHQVISEEEFSNETQIVGTALDNHLDYATGVYLFKETGTEVQTTRILSPTSPNNLVTAYSTESKTAAVYAQATYHLPWMPQLSLTAGGRYTWDSRTFDAFSHYSSGVCRLLTADTGGVPLSPCFRSASASWSKPTYNVSVDWKFDDDTHAYVTHRTGYQAGGFTNSAVRPSEFVPFRPQTVSDYEVGLKSIWNLWGTVGATNIALFRGDYTDIQRLQTVYVDVAGHPSPVNRLLNAATSTVQGVDLDFRFRPVEGVDVTAAYTYLDAKYNDYMINGVDYSGATFAGAPEHTFSGSIRFLLPVPERIGVAHFQVDGSYQSSTVVADTSSYNPVTHANFPTSVIPGYGTVNARLDLDAVAGKPLRLSVLVRNLANAQYYTGGIDGYPSLGTVVRLLGPPRTVGVEANYAF